MSDIHLDKADKDKVIKPEDMSKVSAKQQWYAYRNAAIEKVETIKAPKTDVLLQAILAVLVKIYWEIKKPK